MSSATGNPTLQRGVGIAAVVLTLGICVQTYLAMAYAKGAGADAIDVHRELGSALLVVAVVIAVVAWRAFPGRRSLVGHAASVPLLMLVQFGPARASDAWVSGIHGFLAIVVAVAAGSLAALTLRRPRGG